jgi:hypothetical protein
MRDTIPARPDSVDHGVCDIAAPRSTPGPPTDHEVRNPNSADHVPRFMIDGPGGGGRAGERQ